MPVFVDTNVVEASASSVKYGNSTISDLFEQCESYINTLKYSWDGGSAQSAYDSFVNLKQYYYGPMNGKLSQYDSFMNESVRACYETLEEKRVQLANDFMGRENEWHT